MRPLLTPRRRPRLGRTALATVAAASALVLAACGGSDGDETSVEETTVTPAAALNEVDQVEKGLDDAAVAYERGDAERAEELVSTAYLEHFELVEGPLEEADEELNESLEELIREELRAAIADGASVSEVQGLVDEAGEGLAEARKVLKQQQ